MTLNLKKSESLNLRKVAPALRIAQVNVGWEKLVNSVDVDVIAMGLGSNNKAKSENVAFYNQTSAGSGSITHSGDNRTGVGDGPDEIVTIDLSKLPSDVARVSIFVTIHEAKSRNHRFGNLKDAYLEVVNGETGVSILNYDLDESFKGALSVEAAAFVRQADGSFVFDTNTNAVGRDDLEFPDIVEALVQG